MSKAIRPVALLAGLAMVGWASLVGISSASAQEPPAAGAGAPGGKPAWVVACEADMNKFCATEVKANSDVRPCLAKNEAGLSDSCKDVFLRKYKIIELCKGDFEKLCPGITDSRALTKCLNEKAAEVSDKCKSAMTRGTKQFKKEEAAAEKASAAPPVEAKPTKVKAKKASTKP